MGRSPSTISRGLSRDAGTVNSYSAYEANRIIQGFNTMTLTA
ncbi:MAG: hypothetical protein K5841_06810 [Fretibacterium sp.]|nr:hypothetical protein [Fretibacterium sp.]